MGEVVDFAGQAVKDPEPAPAPAEQTPDTPGNDENADGLKGGQTTADTVGDVLGV